MKKIAYFSMEYGLESNFKIYAGGLGILAGDYLKGAKDNNVPIVGVGIKWKQGYTDQLVSKDNKVFDTYHNYNYNNLVDTNVVVSVKIRNVDIYCKVWKVEDYNNASLYLLDTDIPENGETWICGQLYGWFGEERIAQEMVLGIGGVKALRELNIEVHKYHFNEGHALFAGFELLKEEMDKGVDFKDAIELCKEKIVFTTHTPIVEGNESHPISRLMYMGANNGLSEKQLEYLGGEPFNMTVGGLRLSNICNAVASLHGETANKMWDNVDRKCEITYVTNAIHVPTWVDSKIVKCAENNSLEQMVSYHKQNKRDLIQFINEKTGVKFDEDKLLIGFGRRAAPYKRSDLIFSDEKVCDKLFKDGLVQIVFSGKAHPLDDVGKNIISNIVKISKKYKNSVVFLENYSMEIALKMTRGSDVWLNNPRRPQEASGTSGMKAAMNGVLNLSILDGWWPEACIHGINGWAFGSGKDIDSFKSILELDKNDLEDLYYVLFEEVIPMYYNNYSRWKLLMRNSIITTKDFFSMDRMIKEYYEKIYK